MIHSQFEKALSRFKSQADWVGLRFQREKRQRFAVRNELPERISTFSDQGVMLEVLIEGQMGFAATSDFSDQGLKTAFVKAKSLAKSAAHFKAFHHTQELRPTSKGKFESTRLKPLDALTISEIMDVLLKASKALKVSEKISSRFSEAQVQEIEVHSLSSAGASWSQNYNLVSTSYRATAVDARDSQTRSDNGHLFRCYQVGAEAFSDPQIFERCVTIGEEAMQLLEAPNCPSGAFDLILAPDQMNLQIHESIGHPLELDRILGDERNFAGWSFVKPSDFGELQYGSELLNVVFDPTDSSQFASYAFDDIGNPAKKEYLIQNGKLLRGLGSLESQHRLKALGVANQRASSWNRAPIDRMANINIEPGTTSLESIIANVENGFLMKSNRSWSIDDFRNKFQFGCESAQRIENGKITTPVKNPNYRGQTLPFWRSLRAVSDTKSYETYGSSTCLKGEPGQMIRVSHGSPYCLFTDVEVFGGLA